MTAKATGCVCGLHELESDNNASACPKLCIEKHEASAGDVFYGALCESEKKKQRLRMTEIA